VKKIQIIIVFRDMCKSRYAFNSNGLLYTTFKVE
jgi:hypothetical protein